MNSIEEAIKDFEQGEFVIVAGQHIGTWNPIHRYGRQAGGMYHRC